MTNTKIGNLIVKQVTEPLYFEDDVAVTSEGIKVLNTAPRELLEL